MKSFFYLFAKLCSKLLKDREIMNNYYRKKGAGIGKHCLICSDLTKCELYMLEIGNNVTISTDVLFVTHDHSWYHIDPGHGDLLGKIVIGDNCFIGERATILYGVSLAHNTVVAAGSVVTKSFSKSGTIIGGNPARVIGDWETFKNKNQHRQFFSMDDLLAGAKNHDSRLVKRQEYQYTQLK